MDVSEIEGYEEKQKTERCSHYDAMRKDFWGESLLKLLKMTMFHKNAL